MSADISTCFDAFEVGTYDGLFHKLERLFVHPYDRLLPFGCISPEPRPGSPCRQVFYCTVFSNLR